MYVCIKQQLNGFPSEKEMQYIAEKLRTAPFLSHSPPKCKQAGDHIQTKTNYALRHTLSTTMHYAGTLLSLGTVGGKLLAAWQQNKWKKGLGDSFFFFFQMISCIRIIVSNIIGHKINYYG